MKKSFLCLILFIIGLFLLTSCIKKHREENMIEHIKTEFNIVLPTEYSCLFYESLVSIDSEECYIVLDLNQEYELEYEQQFFTDYAKYETVNIFEKVALAKYYFENMINRNEEKYFVTELENYDWYGYEYKKVSEGTVTVVRFVDLYILHDKNENVLYIFYDKHQYPYNEQN